MDGNQTAMGLAFIQAQQKLDQQEKPVEAIETPEATNVTITKSTARLVFDHLADEGVPLAVHTIAKALGFDNQKVSTALFQLKKVGYVQAHAVPGEYMTYEAVPGRTYGDAKSGRPAGTPNKSKPVSQLVTQPTMTQNYERRMVALPAPAGVKIVVNTETQSYAFDAKEARAIHKQLSALFGEVSVSYDD